jgi:hypothetical protein
MPKFLLIMVLWNKVRVSSAMFQNFEVLWFIGIKVFRFLGIVVSGFRGV